MKTTFTKRLTKEAINYILRKEGLAPDGFSRMEHIQSDGDEVIIIFSKNLEDI